MTLELDVPEGLRPAVEGALAAAEVTDGHLSLELVSEERIRGLNREHRGKDEPTDVLSFPVDEAGPVAGPRELGDVVICAEHTRDLSEAAVHGVLHLCGYDHETDDGEMLALQARVLDGLVAIRAASKADAGAFLAGYEWLFAPPGSRPPDWDPTAAAERLRATIAGPGSVALLAQRDGRIVGICTAYIDLLSVRFGRRCWVEDLAVDPAERSRGIGARLLAGAREWAAAHGASHLELDSSEARTDAHRFYEREGAQGRSFSFGWYGLGRSGR